MTPYTNRIDNIIRNDLEILKQFHDSWIYNTYKDKRLKKLITEASYVIRGILGARNKFPAVLKQLKAAVIELRRIDIPVLIEAIKLFCHKIKYSVNVHSEVEMQKLFKEISLARPFPKELQNALNDLKKTIDEHNQKSIANKTINFLSNYCEDLQKEMMDWISNRDLHKLALEVDFFIRQMSEEKQPTKKHEDLLNVIHQAMVLRLNQGQRCETFQFNPESFTSFLKKEGVNIECLGSIDPTLNLSTQLALCPNIKTIDLHPSYDSKYFYEYKNTHEIDYSQFKKLEKFNSSSSDLNSNQFNNIVDTISDISLQGCNLIDYDFERLKKLKKLNIFSCTSLDNTRFQKISNNLRKLFLSFIDINNCCFTSLKNLRILSLDNVYNLQAPQIQQVSKEIEVLIFKKVNLLGAHFAEFGALKSVSFKYVADLTPNQINEISDSIETIELNHINMENFRFSKFIHLNKASFISVNNLTDSQVNELPDKLKILIINSINVSHLNFSNFFNIIEMNFESCSGLSPRQIFQISQSLEIFILTKVFVRTFNLTHLVNLHTLVLTGCKNPVLMPEKLENLSLDEAELVGYDFRNLKNLKNANFSNSQGCGPHHIQQLSENLKVLKLPYKAPLKPNIFFKFKKLVELDLELDINDSYLKKSRMKIQKYKEIRSIQMEIGLY